MSMFPRDNSQTKRSEQQRDTRRRVATKDAGERAAHLIEKLKGTDPETLQVKSSPDTVVTPFETRQRS